MGIAKKSRILVQARLENVEDLFKVAKGLLAPEKVRRVDVPFAQVDPGATALCLPKRMLAELGLQSFGWRKGRSNSGSTNLHMFGVVRLTIQGGTWNGDAAEIADDSPVVIGRAPLDGLKLTVDHLSPRLVAKLPAGSQEALELEL